MTSEALAPAYFKKHCNLNTSKQELLELKKDLVLIQEFLKFCDRI